MLSNRLKLLKIKELACTDCWLPNPIFSLVSVIELLLRSLALNH